ncbi:MAG: M48 family metallopeptidase [Alphaproteobacteria bacterium]
MKHELKEAKKIAHNIKFSRDKSSLLNEQNTSHIESVKELLYSNELLVSHHVTPDIHTALMTVLDRLNIPQEAVTAFVYASPEINANCFSGTESECVIRFSSSLIDILSNEELHFVMGHEIGHFLLNHTSASDITNGSLENLIQLHSQEISADRIGLISCKNLETALKALMKTASGLKDEYLRFDILTFISQLQKVSDEPMQKINLSHPSMLIRCRALLWFSLHELSSNNLTALDEKISLDLDGHIGLFSKKIVAKAEETLAMWKTALKIAKKDIFSKTDQKNFAETFGDETLNSFLTFLSSLSKHEVKAAIDDKITQAQHELELLMTAENNSLSPE